MSETKLPKCPLCGGHWEEKKPLKRPVPPYPIRVSHEEIDAAQLTATYAARIAARENADYSIPALPTLTFDEGHIAEDQTKFLAQAPEVGADLTKIAAHEAELESLVQKMWEDMTTETKLLDGTEVPEREEIVIPRITEEEFRARLLAFDVSGNSLEPE